MSDVREPNETEVTAVQAVKLWDEFLKKISKDKKLSGRGKDKVSSVIFAGDKTESASKKAEVARRIVKNVGMGYGYMLSTNASLDKRAVPVVWVGEDALVNSKHFTMVVEKGQAVILGKGMKKCVFLSSERYSGAGAELNFDERFGPPNVAACGEEADGEESSVEDAREIHGAANFAAALWGNVIASFESKKVNLPKEVKNGLTHKGNKKREKAFAEEIANVLLSGQSVIYSTNPEFNDREMASYIDDVRSSLGDGHCSMAVECGKVTYFAEEERVVYLSERLRGEEETSEGSGESEA